MLTIRPAIEFIDEDASELLDLLTRANDAGIMCRVRSELTLNARTPWSDTHVVISFPSDTEKAKFMLLI